MKKKLRGFLNRIFMQKENQKIIEFYKDIYGVMEKVIGGEEIQAQFIFNTELIKKYQNKIKSESELSFAVPFWVILDEYLNDIGVRIVKALSCNKENLLEEYQEFQEEFKKVRYE